MYGGKRKYQIFLKTTTLGKIKLTLHKNKQSRNQTTGKKKEKIKSPECTFLLVFFLFMRARLQLGVVVIYNAVDNEI